MIQPYDFQLADVEDLLAHNGTGALVMETGAGKTVIAAETARRSGVRTKLIIAPQGTHRDVWKRTITGLDPDAQVSRIDSTAPGKDAMDALEFGVPGHYLMTPQLFTRWKPFHLRPDMTIVDEIHLLANRDAVGGKALMKFSRSTGSRMGLSGTFVRNNFENLWTSQRFLYPERDGHGDIADISSNRWIDTFCETKADHFAPNGRVIVGELHPGTVASLTPCWRQHFKRAQCCQFHPEGFLAHLPEPIIIRETVELVPAQKNAIRQMQRDYLAYLELATEEWLRLPVGERKKRALVTKLPIVRQTRLSQMTLAVPSVVPRPWKEKRVIHLPEHGTTNTSLKDHGYVIAEDGLTKQALGEAGAPLWDVIFAPDADSPKLDALVRIWRNIGEPIVAGTNSQKFAELVVARLKMQGIRAFEWSGKFSQEQRDAEKERFKAGEYDIVVGVTAAIGTGIDGLQDVSGVLVSLNKDRDLANEIQLEGRLDRRGQVREEGVVHYEIIAIGSPDEGIIDEQLERRLALNKSLRRDLNRQPRGALA